MYSQVSEELVTQQTETQAMKNMAQTDIFQVYQTTVLSAQDEALTGGRPLRFAEKSVLARVADFAREFPDLPASQEYLSNKPIAFGQKVELGFGALQKFANATEKLRNIIIDKANIIICTHTMAAALGGPSPLR